VVKGWVYHEAYPQLPLALFRAVTLTQSFSIREITLSWETTSVTAADMAAIVSVQRFHGSLAQLQR